MTTTTTTRKVTEAQIDAASRWTDNNTHKVFYLVESQSQPGTYYKVQWNSQYRVLQCLPHTGRPCPAAEQGRHCWHLDAAFAAEIEYQRVEQERIERTADYQQEQREHALYAAESNLEAYDDYPTPYLRTADDEREAAQERNQTYQCADGSWW